MSTEAEVLSRLTAALEGLASALASGDAEAVLAAEAPVGTAVSALRLAPLRAISQSPSARRAILDARLALARCRTLGHASSRLTAIVTSNGYGPSGRHRSTPGPVSAVASET